MAMAFFQFLFLFGLALCTFALQAQDCTTPEQVYTQAQEILAQQESTRDILERLRTSDLDHVEDKIIEIFEPGFDNMHARLKTFELAERLMFEADINAFGGDERWLETFFDFVRQKHDNVKETDNLFQLHYKVKLADLKNLIDHRRSGLIFPDNKTEVIRSVLTAEQHNKIKRYGILPRLSDCPSQDCLHLFIEPLKGRQKIYDLQNQDQISEIASTLHNHIKEGIPIGVKWPDQSGNRHLFAYAAKETYGSGLINEIYFFDSSNPTQTITYSELLARSDHKKLSIYTPPKNITEALKRRFVQMARKPILSHPSHVYDHPLQLEVSN